MRLTGVVLALAATLSIAIGATPSLQAADNATAAIAHMRAELSSLAATPGDDAFMFAFQAHAGRLGRETLMKAGSSVLLAEGVFVTPPGENLSAWKFRSYAGKAWEVPRGNFIRVLADDGISEWAPARGVPEGGRLLLGYGDDQLLVVNPAAVTSAVVVATK